MRDRWRGREPRRREQVLNGPDSALDLTPASGTPAAATRAAWAVLLPNQDVPLTWERTPRDEYHEER